MPDNYEVYYLGTVDSPMFLQQWLEGLLDENLELVCFSEGWWVFRKVMDKRMTYGGNGSHWDGCAKVHWDCKIAQLEAENAALREQVANLKMSKTHKARVQAVKHMLEQTAFLRKCFALDVFRSYPRLRDEGLKILDGEPDDECEEEVTG